MPEQLWAKGLELDKLIHAFTVGNDPDSDLTLLPWDIIGTAAHVQVLCSCGLFKKPAAAAVLESLRRLYPRALSGELVITQEQEDCHTLIELELSRVHAEAGRNVHLGRSRNDQVLTALRLFMRDSALQLGLDLARLATAIAEFAGRYGNVIMPGYTHLRRAMPSSMGMWSLAYAQGLLEELADLQGLLLRLDSCPLGSGAGFGVPLSLDRELAASLLAFRRVQLNPLDCANSRGRMELAVCGWIAGVGNTLEKMLWDIAIFSCQEFGYLSLPDAFTTGSSIMPQKRNPDVVELCRARCTQLRSWRNELEGLATGLPGSYHRDFQFQKEALLRSIAGLRELLRVLTSLVENLQVNAEACSAACSADLYATAEAYRRVREEGQPFRDAYGAVGRELVERGADPNWGRPQPLMYDSGSEAGHVKAETASHVAGLEAEAQRVNSRLAQVFDLVEA